MCCCLYIFLPYTIPEEYPEAKEQITPNINLLKREGKSPETWKQHVPKFCQNKGNTNQRNEQWISSDLQITHNSAHFDHKILASSDKAASQDQLHLRQKHRYTQHVFNLPINRTLNIRTDPYVFIANQKPHQSANFKMSSLSIADLYWIYVMSL